MKTIYKYQIPIEDSFIIDLPAKAQILSVQMQGNRPFIWAMVNPNNSIEEFKFRLYGTGHPIKDMAVQYIGTFQMMQGSLVYHLFQSIL